MHARQILFRPTSALVIITSALLLSLTSFGSDQIDSPQALKLAAACENNSDIQACSRAIKLGLSRKRASVAYTFWADSLSNQPGSTEEAVELLRKAVALDPENALATYLLAVQLPIPDYHHFEERRSWLLKAEQLHPEWDGVHAELADMSTPELAQQEWRKAIELAPDDPTYRQRYEQAASRIKEAQSRMHEAEKKAADEPKAWVLDIVDAAKFTCDIEKAEHYEVIAEKHFSNEGPKLTLAKVYRYCQEFEKSRGLYREILSRMEARLNTDLTYDDAIQIDENSLRYLDMRPELMRSYRINTVLAEREQNWGVAQVYLEHEIQNAPSADLYAHLARVNIKYQPDYTSGITRAIEEGLKLDPEMLDRYPDLAAYAPKEKKK